MWLVAVVVYVTRDNVKLLNLSVMWSCMKPTNLKIQPVALNFGSITICTHTCTYYYAYAAHTYTHTHTHTHTRNNMESYILGTGHNKMAQISNVHASCTYIRFPGDTTTLYTHTHTHTRALERLQRGSRMPKG